MTLFNYELRIINYEFNDKLKFIITSFLFFLTYINSTTKIIVTQQLKS